MTLKEDAAHARERWQAAVHELREIRDHIEALDRKITDARDGSEREEALREKRAKLTRRKEIVAEMVERRDRVRDDLVAELKERQERNDSIETTPGSPHWGGSRDVMDRFVVPVYQRHGIPITSRKRAANDPLSISNPGSDHNEANVLADALDGGIANAYSVGDEVGEAVGVGSVDDYVTENFVVDGHTYRIQVIAGTHGTGPHLHTGIARIS